MTKRTTYWSLHVHTRSERTDRKKRKKSTLRERNAMRRQIASSIYNIGFQQMQFAHSNTFAMHIAYAKCLCLCWIFISLEAILFWYFGSCTIYRTYLFISHHQCTLTHAQYLVRAFNWRRSRIFDWPNVCALLFRMHEIKMAVLCSSIWYLNWKDIICYVCKMHVRHLYRQQ